MSEPMSSVEIEDVLSSIRRLVSEDLRPAARSQAPVAPRAASPSDGGKLILTPALRVVPGAEDPAEAPAAPVALEEGLPDHVLPPDADTTASQDWTDTPTFHSVRHDVDPEAATAPPLGLSDADADSPEVFDAAMYDLGHADAEYEAEEAGFVDVDDAPQGEVLILGSFAIDPAPALPADVADALGATVDAPESRVEDTASEADWLPEDLSDWDAQDASIPTDRKDPQPEDGANTTRAWADAAEAEVLRRLAEEAEQSAFRIEEDQNGAQYDEDMLRELVRDIIREELQGALGERITRNVRKLVRAEIARALAVRDFE